MKLTIPHLFITLMVSILPFFSFAQLPGTIAYYPFTGNALDQSGNNNNGQLFGNASANQVLKLGNNTIDYLSLPASIIDGRTDFSISFKIMFKSFHKTGSFPTNHIVTGSTISQLDRLGFSYERINKLWRLALNGSGYEFPDLLLTDVWYCVVLTREGNQAKVYVDGLLVAGVTVNTTAIPCTSLLVGQEEDCSGGCFAKNQCTHGAMDNLTFYDHALTATDVQSICNSSSGKEMVTEMIPLKLRVFPNPANDVLNIDADLSIEGYVHIYSIIGADKLIVPATHAIDISSLPAGLYFIRVITPDGKMTGSSEFLKN
jgi:hypothetical protein